MSDISIIWSPTLSRGDWALRGPSLASGSDLATAILVSLFTDRIAAADDDIPDGTNDPRGWWGDDRDYPIGSRLWLLGRAKQTTETLSRAQDYIAEALKWLIDDGVVAKFDIVTEWTHSGMLGAHIVAYEQSGAVIALNSSSVWTGLNAAPAGLKITI
jgi:phage gp46-like protein